MREASRQDSAWRDFAACKGRTELFFEATNERGRKVLAREAAAKAICSTCVVRRECLDVSLENGEYGIWGGYTEKERRAIVRRSA